MIAWESVEAGPIPRDREVLIAVPNWLGAAYGGDGVKLDPKSPYLVYLAEWKEGGGIGTRFVFAGHWDTRDGGPYDTFEVDADDPAFWSDVNMPVPA